jgi:carbonic anhydrase/acetyltransferase-like protein (isoleucine patch superfamily)
MLLPFRSRTPDLADDVFVADSADVIGDVTIGRQGSVWFQSVLRGDVNWIRLGDRCNVQDGAVVHVTNGTSATWLGDDVTVGHCAIVHGCTIRDRVLVGMGAVVMDDADVGEDSLIGARALVTARTQIPPRSLVLGSPARVVRTLTDDEVAYVARLASHYVRYSRDFMAERAGQTPEGAGYYARPDRVDVPPTRG